MMRPADSDSAPPASASRGPGAVLPLALGGIGLSCLAVITLVSPGTTRMFAWPWSLAYAGALLAPVLALLVRAFDARRPLVLPSLAWRVAVLATAASVLLSALASPYRAPSLLWSAPLLAAVAFFFVAVDALHSGLLRPACLAALVGLCFAATVIVSLALWLPTLPGHSLAHIAYARNAHPLGHANYTAGLALLACPWLAALAWDARGPARLAWTIAAGLAFVMLLSSGSRAGLAGLAAFAFTALLFAPLPRKRKTLLALALPVAALALAFAHPRTRAIFAATDSAAAPNASNVQRAAMLTAAARLGQDRPLLGWGPGTTPLAYPRYRAGLVGGAENVLQLHSTPAQLWAEFGATGLACALLVTFLAIRRAVTSPLLSPATTAAVALAGYAVFSLADWQLDVPVFAFALALCLALLAATAPTAPSPRAGRALGFTVLLALALVALLGHHDPTPDLNIRALTLAREPARATDAIALLRASLAQNPDQEIAHFNLGWLLLVPDPAAAEQHFNEALHLVPDKGGVYFGLGLARLNQNRPATAARALALECLNDPAFLFSPWWREPALAALRPATTAEFTSLTALAALALKKNPPAAWAAAQLPRVAALAPSLGQLPAGPTRAYRRERTAYPVLMRNLDLPSPLDLYDVRESAAPLAPDLPPKGWLPSTLLLELLDAPTSAPSSIENRKS